MYRHTQFGVLMAWIFGAFLVLETGIAIATRGHPIVVATVVLSLVTWFLFHALTVEIDREHLHARFGPGLIRRRVPLREIRSASVVRNRWYYGWGIRLTPHGWLWNVSGFDAVEVAFADGRRFRIGTDRPDELCAAIERAIPVR